MKIIVCVKFVIDPFYVDIDLATGAFYSNRILYTVNPADLCAVEFAVRIKEQQGGTVTVISFGPPSVNEALRSCLAIGADRAVRLCSEGIGELDSYTTAFLLAEAIKKEEYDLILCGNASMDENRYEIGPRLAEFLEIPQLSNITSLEFSHNQKRAIVKRKLEGGVRELVECPLPALFTVEADLNEPRYPSLPLFMAALQSDISVLNPQSLGISPIILKRTESPKVVAFTPPRPFPKRIFTPDSKLPAFERISLILSGGLTPRKQTLIKDTPKEAARKIVSFLIERGVLTLPVTKGQAKTKEIGCLSTKS